MEMQIDASLAVAPSRARPAGPKEAPPVVSLIELAESPRRRLGVAEP